MNIEPTTAGERILVLLPDRNSPPKRDYTGAFRPSVVSLARALSPSMLVEIEVPAVNPVALTITGAAKQKGYERAGDLVCEQLERGGWTRVAMLCHGWSTGLQLGIRIAKQRGRDAATAARFAAALAGVRSVTLFACSAGDAPGSSATAHGDGRGSFGAWLAQTASVPVLAHWTAGHTVRNPDLIHFAPGGKSGVVIAERDTPAFRRARALLTSSKPSGTKPPVGHTRPAWCSLPLCTTLEDVRELLASDPST